MDGCIVWPLFVLLCRKTLAVHIDIVRFAIIPYIHKVKKEGKNDFSSKLDEIKLLCARSYYRKYWYII